MSRGGGGRGGRGGGRGGAKAGPQLSWDNGEHAPDTRPSELFPNYAIPTAKPLSDLEKANVNAFLLFRRQVQDSPLYTRKRTWGVDPLNNTMLYGQEQVNSMYGGTHTSATADPFTAVPAYSQRFIRRERNLPDFSRQPFCKEFFPSELHATLDGDDVPRGERRRGGETKRLQLSRITAIPTAEDAFRMNEEEVEEEGLDEETKQKRLQAILNGADGAEQDGEEDDIEYAEEEEQDVEYDDEDAGDYDAENYFDDGDDGYDDGGDDDGGPEGSY